jgi:uncharacterized cupredoxin-like copper-binding protein
MSARRIAPTLCLTLLAAAGAVAAAAPNQTLGIKLQDSTTDPTITHMRMVLDHDKIQPGRVTLQAVNESKALVHEVVVVRDDGNKKLPFDPKHDRVIESRVHSLGEISDLKPGKTGKLTLDLKPGKYVLLCNEPAHYKDGMVATLTVAR